MNNINGLVESYVALWNEGNAARRREGIAALWTEDGVHFSRTIAAQGHALIEARIAKAYNEFVGSGRFSFVWAGNVDSHHQGVRLTWHMVSTIDHRIAAVGFDFLLLDEQGRIRSDHQFTDPLPA